MSALREEKPVLLLIPGMLNNEQVWAAVAPWLDRRAEVRIADVTRQSSLERMAHDAWWQLADVPATRALALCGFSMGGYVALEMLAAPARAVQAVALVATSARPETSEGAALREKGISAIERDFGRFVDHVLGLGIHAASRDDTALVERMRRMMLGVGAAAAVRQNHAIAARRDWRKRLAALDVPTTIVCGREDRITPPELSRELAELIPNARLEWIERAGHMAPLEQPEQVAAAIEAVLPFT